MHASELVSDAHIRAISASYCIARLSPRQRQVLDQMVAGKLNKQIAYHLRIDETTVKMHRARLLEALDVNTSAAAIKLAVEASFATSFDVFAEAQ